MTNSDLGCALSGTIASIECYLRNDKDRRFFLNYYRKVNVSYCNL